MDEDKVQMGNGGAGLVDKADICRAERGFVEVLTRLVRAVTSQQPAPHDDKNGKHVG